MRNIYVRSCLRNLKHAATKRVPRSISEDGSGVSGTYSLVIGPHPTLLSPRAIWLSHVVLITFQLSLILKPSPNS